MVCPFCETQGKQIVKNPCEDHRWIEIRYCEHCGEPLEYCIVCMAEGNADTYMDKLL